VQQRSRWPIFVAAGLALIIGFAGALFFFGADDPDPIPPDDSTGISVPATLTDSQGTTP